MTRRSPNDALRALLAEAEWTAGELASAVNSLGAAQALVLHYDRTSVAHWISGTRPKEAVVILVAAALSRRIGRLVTEEETGMAPLSMREHRADFPSGETNPLRQLAFLTRADLNLKERTKLVQSMYRITDVPWPNWDRTPSFPPNHGSGFRVSEDDVESIRTMARLVADQMDRSGGRSGRSALAAYLADDVGHMLSASTSSAVRRELLTATAQMTQLLANKTCDAGHHGLAQRYYHTALAFAQEAGDSLTYAVILRAMSTQALQLGHHRQALELAEASVSVSGKNENRAALAYLYSQFAVALAYDRQRHASVTALSMAEAALEQASSASGPFSTYPSAALSYQRAQTLLALGLRGEAIDSLRHSARNRENNQHRPYALTEFRLGDALLSAGYLDEACTRWKLFLDHGKQVHSARIDHALTQLRRTLRPYQRHVTAAIVWERLNDTIEHKGLRMAPTT